LEPNGKTILDFNEARDDGAWGWQTGIGQTISKQSAPCSRHTTTPTPHHSICLSLMPFLTSNQQCQSTEGNKSLSYYGQNGCVHAGRALA